MKKILVLITLAFICFNVSAQTEGSMTKLTYISYVNGQHGLTIKNKMNSASTVKLYWDYNDTTFTLAAHEIRTVNLHSDYPCEKIKEVTLGCNEWLEVNTCHVLPIRFKSITATRVGETNTFNVTFEVEESIGTNFYSIKLSLDGKTWVEKSVVFPDSKSQIYNVTIKL